MAFGHGPTDPNELLSWVQLHQLQPHRSLQQTAAYGKDFLKRMHSHRPLESLTFADGTPVVVFCPTVALPRVRASRKGKNPVMVRMVNCGL